MDEHFELVGQVFEWNEEKARRNHKSHGVSFESAATVFMDSNSVQFPDDEHSDNEVRDVLIGYCSDGVMLRVSFTERPPNIRIFSARVADNHDETQYANGY
jgi:uncharacterized DUF497 family protein